MLATAVLATSVALACQEVTAPIQDPTTITYSGIPGGVQISDYTRDTSGVYYLDVARGSGTKATKGSTLAVRYRGFLNDGRAFDSTATNATPFTFVLGQGQVIKGWDVGLLGVPAGTRRRLIIPPSLGYGSQSFRNRIPAGSVLIFEIDVESVTLPPPTTTPSG